MNTLVQSDRIRTVDTELLERVLRASGIGLWDVDIAAGSIVLSPEFGDWCGCRTEPRGLTYESALRLVHAEDRAQVIQAAAKALGSRTGSRMECRVVRPDGQIRWIELFGAVLRDAQDRPQRGGGIAMDITERRRKEEALRAANEELVYFSYAVSHDLEEPLRGIMACSQMLVQHMGLQPDQEVRQWLRFIQEGGSRLDMMLRDLRTYAETSQPGPPDATAMVDCNAVLEEVLAGLQALISESGACITHDHLPVVGGSRIHFVELFQNLISNAIRYRRSAPPAIHVSAEWRAGEWVCGVRDNGIGIDAGKFEEIFGPFKRLRRDPPGTGMGLAICKRIVERGGGRIWVESEAGRGSTFYFTMPGQAEGAGGSVAPDLSQMPNVGRAGSMASPV